MKEIKDFLIYRDDPTVNLSTSDLTPQSTLPIKKNKLKAYTAGRQASPYAKKNDNIGEAYNEMETVKKEALHKILLANDTHQMNKQSSFKLRFANY